MDIGDRAKNVLINGVPCLPGSAFPFGVSSAWGGFPQ